eukprot:411518-Rhodomonas_salina.1
MKFQEEAAQASLLPQIDEEIDKRLTSAAAESAMATARWSPLSTDAIATRGLVLTYRADPSKMRFYWSEENQYHMGTARPSVLNAFAMTSGTDEAFSAIRRVDSASAYA